MTSSPDARPTRLGIAWPRMLKHKVLYTFAAAAVLAVANVGIVRLLLQESDGIAATVNVAGKMRMLSQRIALEVLAGSLTETSAQAVLRSQQATFEQAYHALRDGGMAFGMAVRALGEGHRELLAQVGRDWQVYRTVVEQYARQDARTSAGRAARGDPAQVLSASDALLADTEALLDNLVLHARDVQQGALYGAYVLFGLDLLLLLLAYGLVSLQVLQPIRGLMRQCRELAAGNYAARSGARRPDELGQLAEALNESAAHIARLLRDVEAERGLLKQAKAMFDGLADNTVAGIYMLDARMNLIYANEQLAKMMAYERDELTGGFNLARFFSPATYESVASQVQARFSGRMHSSRYECTALRADGSAIEIEVFGSAMSLNGQATIIGIMLDISERKRAEASARRAALVYAHTSEAMVVTDADGFIQDINPAFTVVTGYGAAEVVGRRMNLLSSGRQDRAFYERMWRSLTETGRWSGDVVNRRKSGEEYTERLTINTSYDEDGSVNCRIGLFSDVTEKRRREAFIWHQAHYDHLTELPNRQMFHDHLQRSIQSSRETGLLFALVFVDLDLFKSVNDTYGHDEGDELLRLVSRRLSSCVRGSDLVARLGGDEFTLTVHGLKQAQDIQTVCRKVLRAVEAPFVLKHNTVQISASVGVTFYPRDGQQPDELLRNADLAMYASKDMGRNQYCVYSPDLRESAELRREQLQAEWIADGSPAARAPEDAQAVVLAAQTE